MTKLVNLVLYGNEKGKAVTFPFSEHSTRSKRQSQAVLESEQEPEWFRTRVCYVQVLCNPNYNLGPPVLSTRIRPRRKYGVQFEDKTPSNWWPT